MGKNWKGPGGGRGGRGGGRGSRGGRGSGGSTNDTSSCKGHGAIMGTCDAARERETSKEMVNLLNQAIEIMCPASVESEINIAPETATSGSGSVKDMLAQEIAQVRKQKHSATQNVMSVDTKVKGIVMIKIMRKDLCALELVKAIFERVREEKEPCSRHVVRIIPLQRVFFPDNNNLSDNVATIVRAAYPGAVFPHFEREVVVETVEDTAEDSNIEFAESAVEESTTVNNLKRDATEMETPTASNENDDTVDVENKRPRIEPPTAPSADLTESTEPEKPIAIEAPSEARPDTAVLEVIAPTFYPPMNYACLFKARSHNIMTRESAQLTISKTVPAFLRPHFKKAKAVLVVEAFRNICGATLLKDGYEDYEEFNLKKFQTTHCSSSSISNLTSFKPKNKDSSTSGGKSHYEPSTDENQIDEERADDEQHDEDTEQPEEEVVKVEPTPSLPAAPGTVSLTSAPGIYDDIQLPPDVS